MLKSIIVPPTAGRFLGDSATRSRVYDSTTTLSTEGYSSTKKRLQGDLTSFRLGLTRMYIANCDGPTSRLKGLDMHPECGEHNAPISNDWPGSGLLRSSASSYREYIKAVLPTSLSIYLRAPIVTLALSQLRITSRKMPGPLAEASHFRTITIKELHPSYGAEIIGIEFENVTDKQFQEINAAMAKVLPSSVLGAIFF